MSGLSASLLRRAAKAAKANAEMAAKITLAMRERYGCTHSDVDCDDLIDALDYGSGRIETLTVAECDRLMAQCGAHPLPVEAVQKGEG